MKITADRIIFGPDDWTGGLNTQYGVAVVDGAPIRSASAFNPYRPYGIAGPGYLFTAATNNTTVDGLVVSGIVKFATGYQTGLLLTNNGKIHELTFSTNTITNSGGTFPHTINDTHSNPVGEDIIAYSVGSTRYAFYSFRDATDWNIGRYDYATTFDDDYMSTVPASPLASPYLTGGKDAPHPLIVGADDVLYVGDRNFLHGFDGQVGANGTFYPAVLTLPAGYTITSFAKTETFLVIFAYRQDQTDTSGSVRGQASAFFWDYLSLDPTKVLDLDDNYVTGGFTWRGTACCFTTGRPTEPYFGQPDDKRSDLRVFNGSQFEAVASFDGTPPIYRGVDVSANEVQWNTDGLIFSYADKANKGFVLNKIATIGGSGTSGFLSTMTATRQYASNGSSGANGSIMYSTFDSYGSSGQVATVYVRPDTQLGTIARVKAVELFLHTTGATDNTLTLNLNYLGNMGGSSVVVSEDVFTGRTHTYWKDTSGQPFLDFNRISLSMAWTIGASGNTPPLVDTVIIHYEPINTKKN